MCVWALSLSHVWLFVTARTVCSLPGSSVRGILQAGILAWVAMPFLRASSPPMARTQVSCIAVKFFAVWATREALSIL